MISLPILKVVLRKDEGKMKTVPLESISLETAMSYQFRFIDCIMHHFTGSQILACGDLGVVKGLNKPETTQKVEKVIAEFFNVEKALLVRGSGTNAIRYALHACLSCNDTLLVHKAPIYPTTQTSISMLGLRVVEADYNNLEEVKQTLEKHPEIKGVLIQYTRQNVEDSYSMQEVIDVIRRQSNVAIITDDNYAVMKVKSIGVELKADLSCFSTFKLLGPEGIGCIVGKAAYIDALAKQMYSGGLQCQGWEALEVLRGLVYAPVSLAIQGQTIEECHRRLQIQKELPEVKGAYIVNGQSKILLVEFYEDIAQDILNYAQTLGALPYPVGAESKYEMCPLFYKISATFAAGNPSLAKRAIRINPNRAGADTIIRVLKESLEGIKYVSK